VGLKLTEIYWGSGAGYPSDKLQKNLKLNCSYSNVNFRVALH